MMPIRSWIVPPEIQITGGPWLNAQVVTAKRLAAYRPDDLLYSFRQTAGLAPAGTPQKGWQAPTSELRGHFTGHYLSAVARAIRCGYVDLRPNIEPVVTGLRDCQNAIGSGYVSAFPESFIDRVIAREKVWAPWYTLHKIGQGLLEAHAFSETPLAGDVCRKFIGWVQQRMDALSDEQVQRMLETEHGGMADFLAQAAVVFDNASMLVLAKRFLHQEVIHAIHEDNWKWFEGRHANTQIPIVMGMARIGILESDDKLIDAAAAFVNQVLTGWTYPNGGNSDLEHFGLIGRQHDHISAETSETCNTHNMAKLVTLLSTVHPTSHWDTWLNHACDNHLLAAREPGGAGLMYYFPLSPGAQKRFDNPNEDFWCCSGTGIETPYLLPEWIARLTNSGQDPQIEVVQGIPFTVQTHGKMLSLHDDLVDGYRLIASAGTRVVEGTALEQHDDNVRWEALPGDPTFGSFFFGSTLLAFTGLVAPVNAACITKDMERSIYAYIRNGKMGPLPLITIPNQAMEIGVASITSIHSEPYTCIVRGFESKEDLDAWKHTADAEYAAERLLEAQSFDVIHCGSESSELTHETEATKGSYAGDLGPFSVRDIRTGQTYATGINLPPSGPCSVAITYWGGEFRRCFTVRIGSNTFSQNLELDKPNQPATFCYPIPDDTPRDVPIVVSIDPEPGGYAGLVLAIRSVRFASPIHQPFQGETTMQTTPQLTPIRHTEITFRDAFWKPRIDRNRDVTLPHVLEKCEETGRFGNLRAAGRKNLGNPAPQTCEGYCFNDSDVYKTIEGAANILAIKRDAKIERRVDSIIALIAQAQEPDGYLYSPKTIGDPNNLPPGGTKRWESMDASHELYCVGHLYEAAVAHFRATGKRNLLNIAIKNANLVAATFGPGKRGDIDGHPEVELGLSDLYGATGDARYLRLAQWFLARRGDTSRKDLVGEYAQDHKPLV
ncbi:MAG: beta-L-arabinofuranosidase domain-containing protein, partial [Armatimonadota bacterium]